MFLDRQRHAIIVAQIDGVQLRQVTEYFIRHPANQCLEPNRNRTQNPGSFAEPNPNRNPKMLEPEPNPNPSLRIGTEPKEPGFSWILILKFTTPKTHIISNNG